MFLNCKLHVPKYTTHTPGGESGRRIIFQYAVDLRTGEVRPIDARVPPTAIRDLGPPNLVQ